MSQYDTSEPGYRSEGFDFPEGHAPRKGRLITSGIIFGLFGCLLGLYAAYMGFMMVMFGSSSALTASLSPEEAAQIEGMRRMMRFATVISIVFYGIPAVFSLYIGFGSVFMKRWARPLALISAWCLLYLGVIGVLSLLSLRPMMVEAMQADMPEPPPAASSSAGPSSTHPSIHTTTSSADMANEIVSGIMIFMMTFAFIFGVLLPGLLIWLNWHTDVRLTLEFADRKKRWTDRCPIPVLGITVVAAFACLTTLSSAPLGWMPIFGKTLTGNTAIAFFVLLAIVLGFITWATYRQMLAGWAVTMILLVAAAVSSWFSLSSMDYTSLYATMGMPEKEIETMIAQQEPFLKIYEKTSTKIFVLLIGFVPYISYVAWTYRFFAPRSGSPLNETSPA